MKVGQICKRTVISISANARVSDAARLMLDAHVRFLVVHAEGDEARKPIGVVTDREIARKTFVHDPDPRSPTIADIMTTRVLLAKETDDLGELLQVMRLTGLRRVPVVDEKSGLAGLLTLSDARAATIAGDRTSRADRERGPHGTRTHYGNGISTDTSVGRRTVKDAPPRASLRS